MRISKSSIVTLVLPLVTSGGLLQASSVASAVTAATISYYAGAKWGWRPVACGIPQTSREETKGFQRKRVWKKVCGTSVSGGDRYKDWQPKGPKTKVWVPVKEIGIKLVDACGSAPGSGSIHPSRECHVLSAAYLLQEGSDNALQLFACLVVGYIELNDHLKNRGELPLFQKDPRLRSVLPTCVNDKRYQSTPDLVTRWWQEREANKSPCTPIRVVGKKKKGSLSNLVRSDSF